MATRYHRRLKTSEKGHINVSKGGLSYSQKLGKFTMNSGGTVSFNSSVKGLSFRMSFVQALVFVPAYYLSKPFLSLIRLIFRLIKYIVKLPFRFINFIIKQLFIFAKFCVKKAISSIRKRFSDK
jgi:hypothetical protein